MRVGGAGGEVVWWLSGKQKIRKGRRDYEQESLGTKQPSACGRGAAIILVNCYFSLLLSAVVLQKVPSEDDPKVRNHGEGPY